MQKLPWKNILIWTGVILGLFGMVWGLAQLGATAPTIPAGNLVAPVNAQDWQRGNPNAKAVLVEYSDFQCPACAYYYAIVKKIEQKYSDKLLLVYRHFPLSQHLNATAAAQVAETAGKQGKFWEMHDRLFETQKNWSDLADPNDFFMQLADTLKLDTEKFLADANSDEVRAKIEADIDSGKKGNIDSTPSFFLNGKKLTNLTSSNALEQDIIEALK